MADKTAWVLKSVNPQIAPGLVIGHDPVGLAGAADYKFGMAGTAGMLAGGLVAQIERPATPLRVIDLGAVRREATQKDQIAAGAFQHPRFNIGHQFGPNSRPAFL